MNPSQKLPTSMTYAAIVLFCICLLPSHIQGLLQCKANDKTVIPLSPNVYPSYERVNAPVSNGSSLANMTCIWKLMAPPSHILSIDIVMVILSNDSSACPLGQTFQMFDGPNESSRSLFNGCTRVKAIGFLRETFLTSGRHGLIELKTPSNFQTNTTVTLFAKFSVTTLYACSGGVVTNLTATANSSMITNPYNSLGYPKNISCAWRITAPSDQVVVLKIEAKVMCHLGDRLEIYDSEREEPEYRLDKICYTAKQEILYSTAGHVMYVIFSSNTTYQPTTSSRTFTIHYSAMLPVTTCSPSNTPEQNKHIIIRGPNAGNLYSPNYPKPFPPNLDCRWQFLSPAGHVIKMYFDTININFEPKNACLYKPYFRVYDGFKMNISPLLRSINCQHSYGRLTPSFFVLSSGRKLGIFFLSETSGTVSGYGFKANYTFESLDTSGTCGEGRTGTISLRGQGASFSSPGYEFHSNQHPKNMTCLWNITTDPGFIIEINSISNDLTMGCESEFVKVYDGATLDSPVLGMMCYRKTPYYLYSSDNRVIVEMKTSSSNQRGKGFHMSYRAVKYTRNNYVCSNSRFIKIDKPTAIIVSPWYPVGYPNNMYCNWAFTAPFGKYARVNITKLHLQDSKDCKADYITIYGSKYWTSPLLRTLCGEPQTPISIMSSERKLMIRMKSDWIGQDPGFEAVFDSIEDVSFGDCKVQGQDNYLPLNSSNGVFFSPRYPKGIPANMMCTWVITAKEGSYIQLEFVDFDLDYRCAKNSELVIRDGPSNESQSLGTYCGSKKPPSIFSSGRQLWVRFTSKGDISIDKGFSATYRTVTALPSSISCREQSLKKIDSSSGEFASHDYPLEYGNNVLCQWTITVSDSKRAKLTFDSFNIQKTPGCSGDFVEVFDGSSRFSESLGKFCGDQKPEPVSSSGTKMHIRFQSDKTGQYPGFKASFESELSVRTIILIVVFTLVGVGAILSVIGWCCKTNVYTHNPDTSPPDGAASTAGSNMELTTSKL